MKRYWVILIVLGVFVLSTLFVSFTVFMMFSGPSYNETIELAMITEDISLCYEIPSYRLITDEVNHCRGIMGPCGLVIRIKNYRQTCFDELNHPGLKMRNTWNKAIETGDPSLCLTLSEFYEGSTSVEYQCLNVYISRTGDISACDFFYQIGYDPDDNGLCVS